MEKYSKQLVLDYIYGNDIEDYEIEKLENNPTFMSDVMRFSKDKNMYLYASSYVKKNYEFVKLVVEMFKNEQDFIIEVADYYLENANVNEDDITKLELNVIMNDIIKTKEKRLPYAFYCMAKYESLMVNLNCVYNEEKNKEELPDYGLGFIYVYDIYKQSPNVIDYFATRLINKLFYSSNMTLEELIHQNFKNIRIDTINNAIINYILNYDVSLSDYVAANPHLIYPLKEDINKILNNWESYEANKYKRKIEIIHQEGLCKYDEYELIYSFCDYLETVLNKLGLLELYKKYCNDGIDGFILDEQRLSFIDKVYMEYLEELITKLFSEEKIHEFLSDNTLVQPAKIVKFPKKA